MVFSVELALTISILCMAIIPIKEAIFMDVKSNMNYIINEFVMIMNCINSILIVATEDVIGEESNWLSHCHADNMVLALGPRRWRGGSSPPLLTIIKYLLLFSKEGCFQRLFYVQKITYVIHGCPVKNWHGNWEGGAFREWEMVPRREEKLRRIIFWAFLVMSECGTSRTRIEVRKPF